MQITTWITFSFTLSFEIDSIQCYLIWITLVLYIIHSQRLCEAIASTNPRTNNDFHSKKHYRLFIFLQSMTPQATDIHFVNEFQAFLFGILFLGFSFFPSSFLVNVRKQRTHSIIFHRLEGALLYMFVLFVWYFRSFFCSNHF